MLKYHPDTRFLTDFSAGSLPKSQALCVASHLHFCASCRNKVTNLDQLGSELFLQQAPICTEPTGFDELMEKIHTLPPQPNKTNQSEELDNKEHSEANTLPKALRKITQGKIESLNWKNIGKSFKFSILNTGDKMRETTLFHINAGGKVPKHRHTGDEITVVLKGSFSDLDDHYQQGDFIVRTPGEIHTPVASQHEDCLCLSTLDAPIKMSNWFYRLLMPLFNYHHA